MKENERALIEIIPVPEIPDVAQQAFETVLDNKGPESITTVMGLVILKEGASTTI